MALNSLLSQPIYHGLAVYYYEIMRNTEAYTVDIPRLIQSIKAEPVLYHDILEMTASRLRESMYRFENQMLSSGYRQIAHYLLFYAWRFGIDDEYGTRIGISFTHQDIADVVMLTRETVTRELKTLREQGIIVVNDDDHNTRHGKTGTGSLQLGCGRYQHMHRNPAGLRCICLACHFSAPDAPVWMNARVVTGLAIRR